MWLFNHLKSTVNLYGYVPSFINNRCCFYMTAGNSLHKLVAILTHDLNTPPAGSLHIKLKKFYVQLPYLEGNGSNQSSLCLDWSK